MHKVGEEPVFCLGVVLYSKTLFLVFTLKTWHTLVTNLQENFETIIHIKKDEVESSFLG